MPAIDRLKGLSQTVSIKAPCRVVATSNITLNGLQTIDGVTVAALDRVLLTAQTTASENGIYEADSGDWSRSVDFKGSGDCVQGTIVAVTSGTVNNGTVWQLTTASPVIGTSSLAFSIMGTGALSGVSTFMQTVLDDLTAAAARTTLGAAGLTGDETVAGNKTFSGNTIFSGNTTLSGSVAMTSKPINEAQGTNIASATTTDIGAATGNYVKVTGTAAITGLGTVQAGTRRIVEFTGALTLTHNATSLILPTGANITTAAGDVATFVSEGSGNWRCAGYMRADGSPLLVGAANSLAASGYQKLAGGLILQWGVTGSVSSGSSLAITFPTTFGAAVYSVTITPNHAPSGTQAADYVDTVSVTGFTLHNQSPGVSGTYYWMAIGK
jgi:uncharacterized cupin superfamily protein